MKRSLYILLICLCLVVISLSFCSGKDKVYVSDSADNDTSVEAILVNGTNDSLEDLDRSKEEDGVSEEKMAEVDTSLWHKYETDEFKVMYPDGWQPTQYNTFYDFRPRYGEKTGLVWNVNTVKRNVNTVENMLIGAGAQFGNTRMYEKTNITVNGLEGLHIIVTTTRDEDYHYEVVFFETDEKVYVISNINGKNPEFTAFYSSFEMK